MVGRCGHCCPPVAHLNIYPHTSHHLPPTTLTIHPIPSYPTQLPQSTSSHHHHNVSQPSLQFPQPPTHPSIIIISHSPLPSFINYLNIIITHILINYILLKQNTYYIHKILYKIKFYLFPNPNLLTCLYLFVHGGMQ